MISAVAARKAAALSAQNNLVSQPPPPPSSQKSNLALEKDTPVTTAKRKSSGVPESNQNIKKKKKKTAVASKPHPKPKTRYFEERDVFQGQDDIVSIPSDDGGEEELSDVIDEMDIDFDSNDVLPTKGNIRHWSPSRPMKDSSDEDDGDHLDDPGASSFSGPQLESPDGVLSSFQPIANQNFVYIDDVSELSCFDLNPSSSMSAPATLISLKPDETLTLIGVYKLTVLEGSVSLCGVLLSPSRETHEVFAPRSSPLPVITACPGSSESSAHIASSVPNRLKGCFGNGNTVVLVQELRTNVEGLGRVCRIFDGVFSPSSRYRVSEDTGDIRAAGARMVTKRTKDIQPYILSPSWKSALDSITVGEDDSPGIYVVKGPKNSGKSSFARTLLNRLLSRYKRVAYLECDLGQSEFTPGGMVALNVISKPLFGPPFTHPTLPTHAHYIGSTTPRPSPSHYLTSIQSLVEFYRLDVQTPAVEASASSSSASTVDSRISDSIPLVVNTMGWAKGLGADLTRRIEEILEPSHVFEFEAPVFDGGWNTGAGAAIPATSSSGNFYAPGVGRHQEPQHYILSPIPPELTSSTFSSADHRVISLLSYFHAVFPSDSPSRSSDSMNAEKEGNLCRSLREDFVQLTARSWNTSLPLCARYPYEVDVRVALDKVILTGAGVEDVVPSEIERVLGGAVVGLVRCDPGTLDVNPTGHEGSGQNPSSSFTSTSTSNGMTEKPQTLIPYTQTTPPPSPLTSSTYGLALIRSISPGGTHLHVLTPLPPSLLSHTRVMVKGEMELPVWGLLDFRDKDEFSGVAGVERGKVPYLQWGKGEGIGGEKRRVRRNLMRKGQM